MRIAVNLDSEDSKALLTAEERVRLSRADVVRLAIRAYARQLTAHSDPPDRPDDPGGTLAAPLRAANG